VVSGPRLLPHLDLTRTLRSGVHSRLDFIDPDQEYGRPGHLGPEGLETDMMAQRTVVIVDDDPSLLKSVARLSASRRRQSYVRLGRGVA
jgi:hypothetical protein